MHQLTLLVSAYEKSILKIWPLPITINSVVQQTMADMNITQSKLAELFGMTDSKLSKILTGKREPDIQFLKAIHEKLGIDGNVILDRV